MLASSPGSEPYTGRWLTCAPGLAAVWGRCQALFSEYGDVEAEAWSRYLGLPTEAARSQARAVSNGAKSPGQTARLSVHAFKDGGCVLKCEAVREERLQSPPPPAPQARASSVRGSRWVACFCCGVLYVGGRGRCVPLSCAVSVFVPPPPYVACLLRVAGQSPIPRHTMEAACGCGAVGDERERGQKRSQTPAMEHSP